MTLYGIAGMAKNNVDTNPVLSGEKTEKNIDLTPHEVQLVRWEEWALSVEEHFHAVELWQRRPNGLPMGHHHR